MANKGLPLLVLLVCVSLVASATELQLNSEIKIEDLVGEGTYEASGVSLRDLDELLVVMDSRDEILVCDVELEDAEWEGGTGGDAQGFEGVTFDFQGGNQGSMEAFAVVESIDFPDDGYHGVLYTFDSDFTLTAEQELEGVTFETDNKGFEGLVLVRYDRGATTTRYLFALCEGNSCASGSDGKDEGHGRIKVFTESSPNVWELVDTVKLPSSADFEDYSGVDIDGTNIAVVSQQESKLWLGELSVRDGDDFFIQGDGTVYEFPRNSDDDIIYCTIEGITFFQDHTHFPESANLARQIFVVSDKTKSDQPDGCKDKDQSIHKFTIPREEEEGEEGGSDDDGDDDDGTSGTSSLAYSSALCGLFSLLQLYLYLRYCENHPKWQLARAI